MPGSVSADAWKSFRFLAHLIKAGTPVQDSRQFEVPVDAIGIFIDALKTAQCKDTPIVNLNGAADLYFI